MDKNKPVSAVSSQVSPTEKALAAQAKRQEAEARALRANLLRRKQQQRARPVEESENR